MLKLMLCATLALAACPAFVHADPVPGSARFVGDLLSFERYSNGAWVSEPLPLPFLAINVRASSQPIAATACPVDANTCYSVGLFSPGAGNLLYSHFDLGTRAPAPHYLKPDELQCETVDCVITIGDAFSLARAPGLHELSIVDEIRRQTGNETIIAQTAWSFSAPDWIPGGPLSLNSLYGLGRTTLGAGVASFSYEVFMDGVLQDGSVRGSGALRVGRIPTPGTLALLAMGGLVFGLRRHARSKVASH